MAASGLADAASWWGATGRAGWMPSVWLGASTPPSLAGLVVGGWTLEEPRRAPGALPWPGVLSSRTPLAWYDSLEARPDGGGAWAGFDDALAGLRATSAPGGHKARSTFSLANGSQALEEYSLNLARGDSLRDVGVEAMSGTRGAEDGFEELGRHLWGARTALRVRGQRLEGSFAQRGEAGRLEGGESQAASGRSGTLAWSARRGDLAWRLGFARGLDRHESFGGVLLDSDREAQETRIVAEARRAWGPRDLAAKLEWTDASVTRFASGAFADRAHSFWAVARSVVPAPGGRLELAAGLGRHDGIRRLEAAPSAAYTTRAGSVATTVAVERQVTPVWADLAPGAQPFLQRAWVATAKAATPDSLAWHARASLRGGRVYSRALADRLPLEDLWLRSGLRPEYGTYDFALAEGGVDWQGAHAEVGVEGFGLAHRSTALPVGAQRNPRADPDAGFRAWLGGRARLFTGDLLLRVRGEIEGAGAREVEAFGFRLAGLDTLRRLPAFVTASLLVDLVIGDATVAIRLRNLEDRPRELPWLDTSTGLPATTGKPTGSFTLVWRLFD